MEPEWWRESFGYSWHNTGSHYSSLSISILSDSFWIHLLNLPSEICLSWLPWHYIRLLQISADSLRYSLRLSKRSLTQMLWYPCGNLVVSFTKDLAKSFKDWVKTAQMSPWCVTNSHFLQQHKEKARKWHWPCHRFIYPCWQKLG